MNDEIKIDELDPVTSERIKRAPLPTRTTLFMRRFVPYQLVRFAAFNLRSLDVIRRSK